jgi:hypothetical protein
VRVGSCCVRDVSTECAVLIFTAPFGRLLFTAVVVVVVVVALTKQLG